MCKCIKIIRILFYIYRALSYIHQPSQISVHQLNNILQTSSYFQYPASAHHSVSICRYPSLYILPKRLVSAPSSIARNWARASSETQNFHHPLRLLRSVGTEEKQMTTTVTVFDELSHVHLSQVPSHIVWSPRASVFELCYSLHSC